MEEEKKIKKEYAVGERFTCGLLELKVVASESCLFCHFGDLDDCGGSLQDIVGHCSRLYRSDNRSIVFQKVDKDGSPK